MSLAPISAVSSPILTEIAQIAAVGPALVTTTPAVEPAPAAPASPAAALAQMVGEAATTQDGLAPLLADLTAALNAPGLPDNARGLISQILASQTPLAEDASAEDVRAAANNSGLFLEAALAAEAAQPDGAAAPVASDLKAQLLRLIAALAPVAQGPGRAPGTSTPPPVAGGPLAGQSPAIASLVAGADPRAAAAVLSHEAQAALARVQLSQAASATQAGDTTRWMFEAPVQTPGGSGVAQFEISRDGKGGASAAAAPTWRARFSLDVAPSGPVHAELALSGGKLRVTLTAESDAARQAMQAEAPQLIGELSASEDADVAVRFITGAPPAAAPQAGRLVDRRT
jgi:hypothetical protein